MTTTIHPSHLPHPGFDPAGEALTRVHCYKPGSDASTLRAIQRKPRRTFRGMTSYFQGSTWTIETVTHQPDGTMDIYMRLKHNGPPEPPEPTDEEADPAYQHAHYARGVLGAAATLLIHHHPGHPHHRHRITGPGASRLGPAVPLGDKPMIPMPPREHRR